VKRAIRLKASLCLPPRLEKEPMFPRKGSWGERVLFRGWTAWMTIKMTQLRHPAFRAGDMENASGSPGCPNEAGPNVVTNYCSLPLLRSAGQANGAVVPTLCGVLARAADRGRVFPPGRPSVASGFTSSG
jgi:hypothetical protein